MKYELLPGKDKDLRCHVVVTSYETPSDDSCKRFFKSINWAGLIVDEGQRLKNDKNLLYEALNSLGIPFRILLTGTPLQNNTRELFNLLQFLDNSINASNLELEYAELTKENVPKLHDLIRPFFLRRTKAQVLTFLPPMAEIIVPVTMSVVQKKLYQSILAKNPELIKSIFGREKRSLSKLEKSNLNNILMQLRKCLCHPFIYNLAIEERTVNPIISHRNLVAAGSKLQLLEIMLPKLRERGHRVLIFSQFLDMLTVVEDFLDGLGLSFERLDGNIGSLEKQKRIDAFNAPDSTIFAFLLSTRAGGVGINLATADTVIILDPDFNPHQDIQALSRAHRIGQKKKVLVFHLMTRNTAEEKIMQIGKKKMSLDHAIINSMADDEAEEVDIESILKFGASAIFEDSTEGDIRYDSASVDLLLDRSQAEDTKTGEDKSAETQFSFARVWANEHGRLEDGLQDSDTNQQDPTVWDKILQQRERDAAVDAAAKLEDLGRGKRKRQVSHRLGN
jgi:chromodomain-helicase-DNA-binding protein 4